MLTLKYQAKRITPYAPSTGEKTEVQLESSKSESRGVYTSHQQEYNSKTITVDPSNQHATILHESYLHFIEYLFAVVENGSVIIYSPVEGRVDGEFRTVDV
jgi:hypothetical protein